MSMKIRTYKKIYAERIAPGVIFHTHAGTMQRNSLEFHCFPTYICRSFKVKFHAQNAMLTLMLMPMLTVTLTQLHPHGCPALSMLAHICVSVDVRVSVSIATCV